MKKYGVWAVAACAAMVMGVSGCGNDDKGSDKGGDKVTGGTKGGGETKPATNGVEKLTAQQIADKAKAEFKGATSLHIVSDTSDAGVTSKIDLSLDSTGSCAGTFTVGKMGSFEIVKQGDKVWLKPDEAFWKATGGADGEAASELFKGKWLHGSKDDDMAKDMSEACDLSQMQTQMTDEKWPTSGLTKGEVSTVNGQQVVAIKGKHSGGDPITVYVATTGKPYPVKMEQVGGTEPGSAAFSDFGKPVPAKTPTSAESVDMSKLEQLGG